jgi:uncharacterized protein YeaO (DUF488 family)
MTPLDRFNAWDDQMEREMALQDAYETEQLLDVMRAEHIAFVESQRDADQMTRARRLARLRAAHAPLVEEGVTF